MRIFSNGTNNNYKNHGLKLVSNIQKFEKSACLQFGSSKPYGSNTARYTTRKEAILTKDKILQQRLLNEAWGIEMAVIRLFNNGGINKDGKQAAKIEKKDSDTDITMYEYDDNGTLTRRSRFCKFDNSDEYNLKDILVYRPDGKHNVMWYKNNGFTYVKGFDDNTETVEEGINLNNNDRKGKNSNFYIKKTQKTQFILIECIIKKLIKHFSNH